MTNEVCEKIKIVNDSTAYRIPGVELEQSEVGPVMGAHVGPGTLGVVFTSLLPDELLEP